MDLKKIRRYNLEMVGTYFPVVLESVMVPVVVDLAFGTKKVGRSRLGDRKTCGNRKTTTNLLRIGPRNLNLRNRIAGCKLKLKGRLSRHDAEEPLARNSPGELGSAHDCAVPNL